MGDMMYPTAQKNWYPLFTTALCLEGVYSNMNTNIASIAHISAIPAGKGF